MARIVDRDGTPLEHGERLLAERGVTLDRVSVPAWEQLRDAVVAAADGAPLPTGVDLPAEDVARLLPGPAERQGLRGVLVAAPVDPASAQAREGFGVPHHNASSECHVVLGGHGVFGYPGRAEHEAEVFLGVEHGDVVAMRAGTVHRYLPLQEQAFLLRFDAVPGGGLEATDLDLEVGPWIDPFATGA